MSMLNGFVVSLILATIPPMEMACKRKILGAPTAGAPPRPQCEQGSSAAAVKGSRFEGCGLRDVTPPIIENQMENYMENEMETAGL